MMKFGLKETTIQKIQDVLAQFPQVHTAVLYGSRAKGNYRNGSDIDLTLKGDNINLNVINKIELALDELYLPYTFDLSAFNQIDNPDLIGHVNRIGQVFYEREPGKE